MTTSNEIVTPVAVNHRRLLSHNLHGKGIALQSYRPAKKLRRNTISSWNPLVSGSGSNLFGEFSGRAQTPDRNEVLAMLLKPDSNIAKIGRRKTLNTICRTNKDSIEDNEMMSWSEVRSMLRKEGVTTNYAALQFLNHRKALSRGNNCIADDNGKKCDLLSTIGVALLPPNNTPKEGPVLSKQKVSSLKVKTEELILEHVRQEKNENKKRELAATKRRFTKSALTPIKDPDIGVINWTAIGTITRSRSLEGKQYIRQDSQKTHMSLSSRRISYNILSSQVLRSKLNYISSSIPFSRCSYERRNS